MNDIAFTFSQPNNYRVIDKNNYAEISGSIYDYEISNSYVASVQYSSSNGSNTVKITGLAAGIATVGTGNTIGILTLTNFQVRDPALIRGYTLKNGGELFFSEAGMTEPTPAVVAPSQAQGTIAWESFDTNVATVAANGAVTSVGKGTALILGKFKDTWGIERTIPVWVSVGMTITCDKDKDQVINETPDISNGEILPPIKTGDTANWVEIARNGGYSLIVRTEFINWYPNNHTGEASWQIRGYGASNDYNASLVRNTINAWFRGNAEGDADKLPADARLREFTALNNATDMLGTGSSNSNGLTNGFSKPYNTLFGMSYDDIAFALSFTEAAKFLSKQYCVDGGGQFSDSSETAGKNFDKIYIPADPVVLYGMWLRSPGADAKNETAAGLIKNGRAYQLPINNAGNSKGLIYPALWVDTKIFG